MNMEVNQISAEIVLYDVLEIVFKYLEMNDLWNMLHVSKSWRHEALREQRKRFCIQLLRLPCKLSLDNMVHMKPDVSLLICDSRLDSKGQLLENFKKNISCKVVIGIEVEEYLTTQDLEFEDAQNQYETELTSKSDLLGIFFQRLQKQDRIRVAYSGAMKWCSKDIMREADRFTKELGLNDCQYPKSALLFFVEASSGEACYLAANLRNRVEAKNVEESIWYVRCNEMPKILNCHHENHSGITQEKQQIVALRISGPSIKSWTINVNLRLPRIEVEAKLQRFKEEIQLKRHSIGLFYAPYKNLYGSSCELTSCMKRIFSGITFVGQFAKIKRGFLSGLGLENGMVVDLANGAYTLFTAMRKRKKQESMLVIIITYD